MSCCCVKFDVLSWDSHTVALRLNGCAWALQYLRDLYQIPALKSTVYWDHLKVMYLNYSPDHAGHDPTFDYDAPHDRATRFAK